MTAKQKVFVEAFFANNFNASKAAQAAGYANPRINSVRIKNEPEVKAEIDRRLAEYAMPANEVLARLGAQARGSVADLFEIQPNSRYPVFNLAKAFETGAIDLVKSLTPTPDGGIKVELHDAQAALVQLGRVHKLFTDKIEHDVSKLTDAELISRAKAAFGGDGAAGADAGTTEGAESEVVSPALPDTEAA